MREKEREFEANDWRCIHLEIKNVAQWALVAVERYGVTFARMQPRTQCSIVVDIVVVVVDVVVVGYTHPSPGPGLLHLLPSTLIPFFSSLPIFLFLTVFSSISPDVCRKLPLPRVNDFTKAIIFFFFSFLAVEAFCMLSGEANCQPTRDPNPKRFFSGRRCNQTSLLSVSLAHASSLATFWQFIFIFSFAATYLIDLSSRSQVQIDEKTVRSSPSVASKCDSPEWLFSRSPLINRSKVLSPLTRVTLANAKGPQNDPCHWYTNMVSQRRLFPSPSSTSFFGSRCINNSLHTNDFCWPNQNYFSFSHFFWMWRRRSSYIDRSIVIAWRQDAYENIFAPSFR